MRYNLSALKLKPPSGSGSGLKCSLVLLESRALPTLVTHQREGRGYFVGPFPCEAEAWGKAERRELAAAMNENQET